MNINDKIKQILIDKNLTPSYFADEIGVQRSSISHILSGRNRPSFDIIQKIIRRFPDLGYEWIMEEDTQQSYSQAGQTGYGAPRAMAQPSVVNNQPRERFVAQPSVSYTAPAMNVRSQRNEIPPLMQHSVAPLMGTESSFVGSEPPVQTTATEKKVERILIFYSDGSFREYGPSVV